MMICSFGNLCNHFLGHVNKNGHNMDDKCSPRLQNCRIDYCQPSQECHPSSCTKKYVRLSYFIQAKLCISLRPCPHSEWPRQMPSLLATSLPVSATHHPIHPISQFSQKPSSHSVSTTVSTLESRCTEDPLMHTSTPCTKCTRE